MPRDLDLDFEFQDGGIEPRPRRQAPPREISQGMQGNRGNARRKKDQTTSIIILVVEIIVFIALVVLFFVLKSKIDKADTTGTDNATATEGSAEAGESSGGVNVESNDFTLTCTKVQLANDANGSPAALIYFTFVNKTDTPMSMSEVFPPTLVQNGAQCPTDIPLTEYPTEYTNKDMQVSGGQTVECCYAFGLSDLTSSLTLTIHDNYSTFTDIGSTEIPIS